MVDRGCRLGDSARGGRGVEEVRSKSQSKSGHGSGASSSTNLPHCSTEDCVCGLQSMPLFNYSILYTGAFKDILFLIFLKIFIFVVIGLDIWCLLAELQRRSGDRAASTLYLLLDSGSLSLPAMCEELGSSGV